MPLSREHDAAAGSASIETVGRVTAGLETDARSSLANLLDDFAALAAAESRRLGESEDAGQERAIDAATLVVDLHRTVNRFVPGEPIIQAEERERARELWSTPDPEWVLSTDPEFLEDSGFTAVVIDKMELAEIAARYVLRPWLQHGAFEWALLEALLYSTIVDFAVALKHQAPRYEGYSKHSAVMWRGNLRDMRKSAFWSNLLWGWGTPVLLAWALIDLVHKPASSDWWYYTQVLFLGSLLASSVYFLIRDRFSLPPKSRWDKRWALWRQMREMYQTLPREAVLSPREIRKILERFARRGVEWPSAAYVIVDRAISHNPAAWIREAGLGYCPRLALRKLEGEL